MSPGFIFGSHNSIGSTLNQAVSAAPMAQALIADYPEVEHAVRLFKSGSNTWLVKYGDTRFYEDALLFADSSPDYYDFFPQKG